MALLVNYEGVYTEPQKLWYLVDGVWKEVVNIYESPIQQEIAIVDAERINQDKTVLSLSTKIENLQASIDGSDPTVTVVTDPSKIELINEEMVILNLQLEIAKLEQVAITKQLFEQKAQLEYKTLVLEGEKAIEKISDVVDSVANWGVIRIDPQDAIDERLEIAIQHNLDSNERIFNYGAVYYRLYKLNQINIEDNLADLSANFKRRLSKTAYTNGTIATNYIMTTMDVSSVFNEVSQFVSSGSQRILDFLASLQDQQKYIFDNMEMVKANLMELEEIALTSTLITKDTNGKILTNSTSEVLKNPIGQILLNTQGASDFYSLISTEVLAGIEAGTIEAETYPSYVFATANISAVAEKILAITTFKKANDNLLTDIQTGAITFTGTAVLAARKESVTDSKNLFWNSQLGTSSISVIGGTVSYNQSYTSSGTYKFKTNELVTLSTQYVAIINTILANTKNVELAVSFGTTPVRIVQVIDANTIQVEMLNETSTSAPAIVNTQEINTKNGETNIFTVVNDKDQPHTSIAFVKEANSKDPGDFVNLDVYHPVINTVFYPETFTVQWAETTAIRAEVYDAALYIYEVGVLNDISNISFNTRATTTETVRTEFVVSHINSDTSVLGFNTKEMEVSGSSRSNVITNLSSDVGLVIFNVVHQESTSYNTSIITQFDINVVPSVPMMFNTKTISGNEYTPKNGYSQKSISVDNGLDSGFTILTEETNLESILYNFDLARKSIVFSGIEPDVITSQTGLSVYEINVEFDKFDKLNILKDVLPKISSSNKVSVFNADNLLLDTINVTKIASPIITTKTTSIVYDTKGLLLDTMNVTKIASPIITTDTHNEIYDTKGLLLDRVNIVKVEVPIITTSTIERMREPELDNVNKSEIDIVAFATQLNPGVLL